MLRRLAVVTSLVVLYAGCYADTDSYVPALAKQSCKRQKRCDNGDFVDQHNGDMGRCRDDVEDDLFELEDLLLRGGWEYDQDAGQKCIATMKDFRTDCSDDADREIAEACNDVLLDGF